MARWFSLETTPTDVTLRAVAISAVVHHHVHLWEQGHLVLAGGMTVLLMLSGFNFARFAMAGRDGASVRASIIDLGRQVLIPSLLVVVASFIAYSKFDWRELLFIRNWFDTKHISAFHVWYPQMLIQLLALLMLLCWIPGVPKLVLTRPLLVAAVLFSAGVLLRGLLPLVWSTRHLRNQVPPMLLWNFALGVLLYFLVSAGTIVSWRARLLACTCVLTSAFVGWGPAMPEFWWLSATGMVLALAPRLVLPVALARVVLLVGAATFGIFLTHTIWFKILNNAYGIVTGTDQVFPAEVVFVLGLLMSTLTWVAWKSFARAYRATAGPMSASGRRSAYA